MKTEIHPQYVMATVKCACGYEFKTRSTRPQYHLEICSNCHPFFTGRQKLVDSAGRVEKFTRRFEKTAGKTVRVKAKVKAAGAVTSKPVRKILSTGARKAVAPPIEKKKSK